MNASVSFLSICVHPGRGRVSGGGTCLLEMGRVSPDAESRPDDPCLPVCPVCPRAMLALTTNTGRLHLTHGKGAQARKIAEAVCRAVTRQAAIPGYIAGWMVMVWERALIAMLPGDTRRETTRHDARRTRPLCLFLAAPSYSSSTRSWQFRPRCGSKQWLASPVGRTATNPSSNHRERVKLEKPSSFPTTTPPAESLLYVSNHARTRRCPPPRAPMGAPR